MALRVPIAATVCWAALLLSCFADVTVPPIFSDHLVLLRDAKVPIWGAASPGETITVTLGAEKRSATAGPDGAWRVEFDLQHSEPGPFELLIAGQNTLTIRDVLVGEVWVASGQSNMEFALKRSLSAEEELALPANPQIRQFRLAHNPQNEPSSKFEGAWEIASPDTRGNFSAVSYYFSKVLQEQLRMPVGMILTCWSGSACEAWISAEALRRDANLGESAAKLRQRAAGFEQEKKAYIEALTKWIADNQRADLPVADRPPFAELETDAGLWRTVRMPGRLSPDGAESGIFWVRRDLAIAAGDAGKSIRIDLGPVHGFITAYWNGDKVHEAGIANYSGSGVNVNFYVPSSKVKAGRNVLALRVYAPDGVARLAATPENLRITTAQGAISSLSGDWQARAEQVFPPLDPAAKAGAPRPITLLPPPNQLPSLLYNGMIHPLLSFAIRGAIWYQGEANTGRASQYRTTFPMLIEDWRAGWQRGDFPFYFCQLPNNGSKRPEPGDSNWAETREAQTLALKLPRTGQAILIDVGEAADIHPRTKKPVGERLARLALANDYGKPIEASGPLFKSMAIEGSKIRIQFTGTAGGLAAAPLPKTYLVQTAANKTAPLVPDLPESGLQGFALCGSDRKWVWANAEIDGESVVVWSPKVAQPVAVRYAWANNPTCNLTNTEGLPASPFRTDDFPETTREKRY